MKKKPRPPKPLTPEFLARAARDYLRRFPSSSGNLKTVLQRRIKRRLQRGHPVPDEALAWVDDVVRVLEEGGGLNDRVYATALSRSLLRQGRSLRGIQQRLRHKKIDPLLAEEILDALRTQGANPDLKAAHNCARRRRLGPYARDPEKRKDRRQKDLAALARQGYSYAIASVVIDGEAQEECEEGPF
jgi:regulatory protein